MTSIPQDKATDRRLRSAVRVLAALIAAAALVSCTAPPGNETGSTREFDHPQRVTLIGYDGDAMEPFITRDGRYLLFNNLNEPSVNTNLHYAERIDDLHFEYKGEIAGVNTAALEGVPSMDRNNVLYFVSLRSYEQTLSTIYRGNFSQGRVTGVELVPGVSRQQPWMVNFDVDVSPDGNTLYFVDGRFGRSGPETADIVVAQRRGSSFERASNSSALLHNVNSDALEYAPAITADGLTLFFTRAQPGIIGSIGTYVAHRSATDQPFGVPLRLTAIDGLAEAPALSPDERSLYFHKKDGAKFVLYRVSRP